MNTASESSKLVELRAKTDRQLVEMIGSRVAAGLAFARLAAGAGMRGCRAKAELLEARARKNYEEGHVLLPCVRDISKAERRTLERKLEALRESINEVPLAGNIQVRAAS